MVTDEEWKKQQKRVKKIEKSNNEIINKFNFVVIIVLGLFVLWALSLPANAAIVAITSGTNFTLATQGTGFKLEPNSWYVTAADMAAVCGQTPSAWPYPSFCVREASTGIWARARNTSASSYPAYVPIFSTGADAPTYDLIGLCTQCPISPAAYTMIEYFPFYNSSSEVPFQASFTAVPQAGNATLSVNFTPAIYGPNLDRVVWDYDGGLGTETKYSEFNTSFIKNYSTAGFYTVRMTAYQTNGTSISASKGISVYNYTLGITPTPTLTPTPTPTGQTNETGQITISGIDGLNFTSIPSLSIGVIDYDDVGSGWFNVTANNGTYTLNGYGVGGNKPFVLGHKYVYSLSKTGYITYTTSGLEYAGKTAYEFTLTPTAYVPTASNFVLAVALLSDGENIHDNLIGTVKISNQSSAWTATTTNPENGFINFAGLTPSASYKIDVNINGYESYTGYFASSSSMAGSTQYYYAYLTPTNKLPSSFTLSVAPDSGTVNDTFIVKINGDLTNANQISIRTSSTTKGPSYMQSGSGYTQYSKVAGVWKQWDGSGYTITASPIGDISTKILNPNPNDDEYTVTAYITISGNVYDCSDTISIVSLGKEFAAIWAFDDSQVGGGVSFRMPIMDYTSHIFDVYTGIWTNTTYTADTFGTANYVYVKGSQINYYGSAYGYPDTPTKSKVLTGTENIEYSFHAGQVVPIGNTTLYVHVQSQSGQPIPSAKVILTQGTNQSGNGYTNSGGSLGFSVISGLTYTGRASAYGYMGATGSINVTNSTEANVLNLVLIKSSSLPTTTGAYDTPTTPKVTPTFTGYNASNASLPWGNQVEYTCESNPSKMEGGVLGVLMNLISCMGVKGAVNQGLALYIIVTCGIALYLSRYAKGMGVMAGVIIGTSAALVMGLIPFWILIFVIIVCGLAFASLLGQGPDK